MAKEYIEREALRRDMTFRKRDFLLFEGKTFVNFENVRDAVLNAPTADVVEVRHGRWISYLDGDHIMPERYYQCSECGIRGYARRYNYCPYCGAKMDGKGEGE